MLSLGQPQHSPPQKILFLFNYKLIFDVQCTMLISKKTALTQWDLGCISLGETQELIFYK